jgi:feruloyl-CoA synthase
MRRETPLPPPRSDRVTAEARRIRPVHLGVIDTTVRRGSDGVIYLKSSQPLGPYPIRITDCLERWAGEAPDRTFLAERPAVSGSRRTASADWRRVSYADALTMVRSIGQALLDRKLSVDRPVLILSGNGVDHGLMALAAMYVGIPYAPIAPAYSLQAQEFTALRQVFERMRPGLVFAADGARFERALREVLPPGVELVTTESVPPGIPSTPFELLVCPRNTPDVDAARDRVGPDTVAKVLFTSGSTGRPKGVINTQRMLCSNQEMIRTVLAFLGDAPPVLCDWLPWNHTAGGNHNFGLVLYNGGSLYIDEGKPSPALFGATLRNLREIPCTAHFEVPRFYEMLMPHLRSDAVLRDTFFRDLKLLFYAAAGLGQKFWDELRELSLQACGEELLIMTGFGSTETAPFAFTTGPEGAFAGMVGFPAPELEVKLAPVGAKLEARVRGPNITPGYWRDGALTAAAFDDEGFYKLGDAMRLVDPADPSRGLIFDGRLAEDFKLSTGTWVSVGPLRARILAAAGGLAQDAVITGHDREFAGALVFPNLSVCRDVAGLAADAPVGDVLGHPAVVRAFQDAIAGLARDGTGSSTFVARAIILDQPPSLDAREITDKGSINQKVVLQRRAALVDELYAPAPSARVLIAASLPT